MSHSFKILINKNLLIELRMWRRFVLELLYIIIFLVIIVISPITREITHKIGDKRIIKTYNEYDITNISIIK